eukprot:GHRQ01025252.1.p1 GENE.GHRQ01025252.1~~GHRQ01025252.1.p1  ORF type:complete len:193 (+),score=32.20 GHRQ01025252.1:65-643(+)
MSAAVLGGTVISNRTPHFACYVPESKCKRPAAALKYGVQSTYATNASVPSPYPVLLCLLGRSAVAAANPLARAEWLKYFGSFFNKEYEAEMQYRAIRNNYNGLKRSAQASKPTPPLVVAWVYKGWNADFVVSKPSYKVAYVEVRPQDTLLPGVYGVLLANSSAASNGLCCCCEYGCMHACAGPSASSGCLPC